jgi:hypothetical protein
MPEVISLTGQKHINNRFAKIPLFLSTFLCDIIRYIILDVDCIT